MLLQLRCLINRTWLYTDIKVLVVQANAQLQTLKGDRLRIRCQYQEKLTAMDIINIMLEIA